ncbi:MAG: argininosuccinate lyase, partial [Beijerinckiaceae bacterium]|nr:argininosuccinate lyase [Beijerinckiaceae bacterium]
MNDQSNMHAGLLWGGRFSSPPDAAMMRLSRASPADFMRLVPHDLAGSRAHANELLRAGVIDADECERIKAGTKLVEADIASGRLLPSHGD